LDLADKEALKVNDAPEPSAAFALDPQPPLTEKSAHGAQSSAAEATSAQTQLKSVPASSKVNYEDIEELAEDVDVAVHVRPPPPPPVDLHSLRPVCPFANTHTPTTHGRGCWMWRADQAATRQGGD
jgi:hypothetical protein